MTWPTPQEYNEAIQNPQFNFHDEELKAGIVELNKLGLPQPSTGAFASVYRMKCGARNVAVRCFLQSVSDQPQRYKALAETLHSLQHRLFVNFEFVDKGIRVRNEWHPIVKMDWVEGKTLDAFVREHYKDAARMQWLAEKFQTACAELNSLGIAHGDLQHGNIIVEDDQIRLIDYDGSFVEAIAPLGSNELGHPNYQHPGRSKALFAPHMDNFSTWVIHGSLTALWHEPNLLRQLHGCEECLILRHIDYAQPARSAAFHAFESSENENIRALGRQLRSICAMAPSAVPRLGELSGLPEPIPLAATADTYHLMNVLGEDETVSEDQTIVNLYSHLPAQRPGWPSLREYTHCMRSAPLTFSDKDLKAAKPFKKGNDIWRQIGKESVVFPMQGERKRYAVKCFLSDDPTRAERYKIVQEFFRKELPWNLHQNFLQFQYIEQGVRVKGEWFPILKMEWLPGASTLDAYIQRTPATRFISNALAEKWRDLLNKMRDAGIAHGNLEPANILMHEGTLKLVDYDTMYVPTMAGKYYEPVSFPNLDLAHPFGQKQVSPHADNFAAWLIDTSLMAWALDPAMYKILDVHHGQLLFRASDLADPANSKLFALLHHNFHNELAARAELLFRFLHTPPHSIPPLTGKAVALLPVETKKRYEMRLWHLRGRTNLIVGMALIVMLFASLPNGAIAALLPTAILIYLLADLLRDHKQDTGRS
jgi:tRNA A-37 threonylcarbamoyl transferase component Bud32